MVCQLGTEHEIEKDAALVQGSLLGFAGHDCNSRQDATVFELAGQDRAGLLADITDLMTANSCHVCSAAVHFPCHLLPIPFCSSL